MKREWMHRWFLHWFQCPSCGHRSFVSRTKASVDLGARKVSWQYWCDRCHRGAVLRHPRLNTYIWLGVFAPIIVALFFLGAPAIGYLACVGIVPFLWLAAGLLTRITNSYAPANAVEP